MKVKPLASQGSSSAAAIVPNPERGWMAEEPTPALDREEIERRIGPIREPMEQLSGGLANVNVRIDDQVLRIHRRAPASASKEAALLRKRWTTFRVPKVLREGADFLLLELVEHLPLRDGAAQGAAVGRALAEIHRTKLAREGFLDQRLAVTEPLPSRNEYVRSQLDALPRALRQPVMELVVATEPVVRASAGSAVLLHGDFKASNLHWTPSQELLVLDWEFAYAGPAMMDVGQLLRWAPSPELVSAFAEAYRAHGGTLPDDFITLAPAFDVVNLVGLLASAKPGGTRATDLARKLSRMVAASPG